MGIYLYLKLFKIYINNLYMSLTSTQTPIQTQIQTLSEMQDKKRHDFYNLLNTISDDECDECDESDECNKSNDYVGKKALDNRCKITDNKLEDNFIELSCGHKFNYIPLYNEIKYQKTNKYSISYDYTKLCINQIKCPYCRTITNNLLPYFNRYKEYNIEMIRGVNTPSKYSLKINSCQHKLKSSGKFCNNSACKSNHGILCNKHYTMMLKNSEKLITSGKSNVPSSDININYDIDPSLFKMKISELKNILRNNNCRVSGNKHILIERILLEQSKNPNWLK